MVLKLSSLKEKNTITILEYIIKHQPISRAEISSALDMNKVSVSQIVQDLIKAELIDEVGVGESTNLGGRKPVLLTFNHKAGVSIGIDIGISSICFVVSYLNGNILLKEKIEHEPKSRNEKIIDFLTIQSKLYQELPYEIVGVTISVHGIVDENEIIFTPNYDISTIKKLENLFEFPVFFENEGNLAALAHAYMVDDYYEGIAAITLRTGVGSGVVYNKNLYKGYQGVAGELGHIIVVPNGRACTCGNQGCLEQYVSIKSIVKQYNKLKNSNEYNLDDFIEAFHAGDETANRILDEFFVFLAIAINNFNAMFSIQRIYLVGSLVEAIEDLPEQIEERMHSVFSENLILKKSPYGKFASAIGASLAANNHFIKGDSNDFL